MKTAFSKLMESERDQKELFDDIVKFNKKGDFDSLTGFTNEAQEVEVRSLERVSKLSNFVIGSSITEFENCLQRNLQSSLVAIMSAELSDDKLNLIKAKVNYIYRDRVKESFIIEAYVKTISHLRSIEIKHGVFEKEPDLVGDAINDLSERYLQSPPTQATVGIDQFLPPIMLDSEKHPFHWSILIQELIISFLEYLPKATSITTSQLGAHIAKEIAPKWTLAALNLSDRFEKAEGFNMQNSVLLGSMSQLIYAPQEIIGYVLSENLPSYKYRIVEKPNLRAVAIASSDNLILTFRGTDNATNWLSSNVDFRKADFRLGKQVIKVHTGFLDAVRTLWDDGTSRSLRLSVEKYCAKYPTSTIYVTGHSLGGAMAGITYLFLLSSHINRNNIEVYTFAQPKWCANDSLGLVRELVSGHYYRVVRHDDVVPTLPLKRNGFDHVGTEYNLSSGRKITSGQATSHIAELAPFHLADVALQVLGSCSGSAVRTIGDSITEAHSMDSYVRQLIQFQQHNEVDKMFKKQTSRQATISQTRDLTNSNRASISESTAVAYEESYLDTGGSFSSSYAGSVVAQWSESEVTGSGLRIGACTADYIQPGAISTSGGKAGGRDVLREDSAVPRDITASGCSGTVNNYTMQELMSLGDNNSSVSQGQDIVIFLGNTKAGKSTLINYLIGNKLTAVRENHKTIIQKTDANAAGPIIGSGSVSETSIPEEWHSDLIKGEIWDCPGFGDNRSLKDEDNEAIAKDIINAFYIKKLLDRARSVKFIR